MSNVQLRISVLHVPGELSALKLRGWLQQQARDIQSGSGENAFVQIKLFLTKRQQFAFSPGKLDKLLKSIVDGYPAIHRIELIVVERELTPDQMREAAQHANDELQEMAASLEARFGPDTGPTVH